VVINVALLNKVGHVIVCSVFCYIIIGGNSNVIIIEGGNCEHYVQCMLLSSDLKFGTIMVKK
jgi:hypothetical protein